MIGITGKSWMQDAPKRNDDSRSNRGPHVGRFPGKAGDVADRRRVPEPLFSWEEEEAMMTTIRTQSQPAQPTTRANEQTADATHGDETARRDLSPRRWGPVILAVSDGRSSVAATQMAARIAARLGVALRAVTVLQPIPIYSGPTGAEPMPLLLDEERWRVHEDTVREHLQSTLGADGWDLRIRLGGIIPELAAAAREYGASLVVMGSAPHRRGDHFVAGVRAAQLARKTPCPVFSVAPTATALPRRIVSALDFGPPSLSAAGVGLAISDDQAHATLVNVPVPADLPYTERTRSGGLIGGDVDALFATAKELLAPFHGAHVRIDTVHARGTAAEAVLDHADACGADLITVGTHGPSLVERLVVGSVATTVLHLASVSVLVAPRPSVTESVRYVSRFLDRVVVDDASAWGELLDAFSRRNVGRTVTLDVDDPTVGEQLQARNYVLHGLVYDPHDRRVECMVSTLDADSDHLTRLIGRVKSIAFRARDGHDRALEIEHEKGYTTILLRSPASLVTASASGVQDAMK